MTEDTHSLNHTLKKAVNSQRLTSLQNFNIIRRYWKVIIGDALEDKTAPLKLENKTLFILVKDAAYRHHLDYFTDDIIELIASEAILGEGKVTRIQFRVGEQEKEPEIKTEQKQHLKPLKSEEEKKVTEISDNIKDDDLRGVFAKWMAKIKRRENG